MRRLPLRRLLTAAPEPARIFYTNLWFADHTSQRYEELLPRLDRLDAYLLVLPSQRGLRALSYRALHAQQMRRLPVEAGSRRYRAMLTTDLSQIPWFAGEVVADVDDPYYTSEEIDLLNRANVQAYVVTAERAAARYRSLGVTTPHYVVPQGVSLRSLDAHDVTRVREQFRRDGEFVVGYMAAWLLAGNDRGGDNTLYNVDHLIELWEEVRHRLPRARLWLLGGVGNVLRKRLSGRDDVVLLGRIPRDRVLAYVANFDVALYPRERDEGIRAAKVAEYLGAGVPTVSYDYAVTSDLADAGAGVLVQTPRDFVDAVVRLAADPNARERLAAAARAAGRARDWDVLAGQFASILDRHLPVSLRA